MYQNNEIVPEAELADITAERAIIGSCMIDPDAIAKIANVVTPDDFFRETHRWIFAVMLKLHDQQTPIDLITVFDTLDASGKLDEIGPSYLSDAVNDTPTAMYVQHYAGIVEKKAIQRRLLAAAGKVAQIAYDGEKDADEALSEAEKLIFGVAHNRTQSSMFEVGSVAMSVMDNLENIARNGVHAGIPSGYQLIDKMLGGFQPTELVIVAARPGVGKSSLAINIAENAARLINARTAIFSLEMSKEQLVKRMISGLTGINSFKLRQPSLLNSDEWAQMVQAASKINALPIHIDDQTTDVDAIRREARRLHAEIGLDMIIVDYIQIASGQGGNREQEVSYITRSLKHMAKELGVVVVALAQLNRGVESRADKRPMLSDLRESGSVEQEADSVLFLYRDDYYNEYSEKPNTAEVIVSKNRHGATGTVSLYFDKERTKFSDLEIERHELYTNGTGPKTARQAVTA